MNDSKTTTMTSKTRRVQNVKMPEGASEDHEIVRIGGRGVISTFSWGGQKFL